LMTRVYDIHAGTYGLQWTSVDHPGKRTLDL
jgi:hypothetical protein